MLFANTDWYLFNFRLSLANALRDEGWQVVFVSPAGEYAWRLQYLGFQWDRMQFSSGGVNIFKEAMVVVRLARLYRRERPLLVHHFTVKCNLYGTLAAFFARGIRVVNSITGLGHVFIDNGRKARLLRCVVSLFYCIVLRIPRQEVIFENLEDQKVLSGWSSLPGGRSHIIRGAGVDCRRFSPRFKASNDKSGRVRVLLAARLIREKGICEYLDAARVLEPRVPGIEFVLAGERYEGNPSSLTEADIAAIRREGIVNYLGHVSDMPSLLDSCHIFVLPSYREGAPSSLFEAAACGKPIVATNIAGCRGIVRDGVNGFLVPVKNAEELAAAIERLACDPGMRERFGMAGREIVMRNYDARNLVKQNLRVYQALMESGSCGRIEGC